jgi:hypothetical protein
MPLFLQAPQIKESVSRLASSRAQSRLLDYLIFKRALVLSTVVGSSEEPRVTTGLKSVPFQQAIHEWAQVADQDQSQTPNFFFNPFGSKRDQTGGYRAYKYRSNGPSDTVNGWQGGEAAPFVYVRGTSPKAYTFVEISPDHMRRFLLTSSNDQAHALPHLSDVAVWWLRARDLETLGLSADSSLTELVAVLTEEVSMTQAERESIFEDRPIDEALPLDTLLGT